jgi:hypothetical protein
MITHQKRRQRELCAEQLSKSETEALKAIFEAVAMPVDQLARLLGRRRCDTTKLLVRLQEANCVHLRQLLSGERLGYGSLERGRVSWAQETARGSALLRCPIFATAARFTRSGLISKNAFPGEDGFARRSFTPNVDPVFRFPMASLR